MFEDIGRPNLVGFLVLGAVGVVLPRLLPEMGPAVGTAVKIVVDLFTESEAEAAEELMQALVSGTVAEIQKHIADADTPEQGRQSAERAVARFKRRARGRAHRWGSDDGDRRRRYHRHLRKLQEEVQQAINLHNGWQRDILDDVGDALEEAP